MQLSFSCQQRFRDDAVSFGNGVEYVPESTLFSSRTSKATINVKLYNFDKIDLFFYVRMHAQKAFFRSLTSICLVNYLIRQADL